jgi:hypothetical protein
MERVAQSELEQISSSRNFDGLPTSSRRALIGAVKPLVIWFAERLCEDLAAVDAEDDIAAALALDDEASDSETGNEKTGVYGLIVDRKERTIQRKGCNKTVSLAARPVLWHVFRVLFDAGGAQVTIDQLLNGYPGDWNGNARNQVYRELCKLLKRLGVTVRNRRLVPLGT